MKHAATVCVALALLHGLFVGASRGQATAGQVVILVEAPGESPLPCRIHLKDPSGKAVQPKAVPFWFDHFDTTGRIELDLAPGTYTYEVEHGPEYTAAAGEIRVTPDGRKPVGVLLKRLADMAAEGWWSGDLHVHRPVEEMPLVLQAEDVHVAPVITWWNERNVWKGKQAPKHLLL